MSRKKILVVEDDPVQNKILSHFLSSNSYDVLSEYDGKNAYNILKNEKIDLVISDILMEPMSGLDLKKELNKDSKLSNIPFVFLTSLQNINVKETMGDLGAYLYIVKPFVKIDLVEKLSKLLGEKNSI